ESFNGSIPTEVIQIVVDAGYLNNHVEELKTLGYTNVDYSAATGSSNATTHTQAQSTEPAKTPDPFTVETYNPAKTMWATQIVNCREGASTEYNKVGSLKEHEQVNVTGVAYTGWYQITKEDGAVVYVSNKYLTEEAPTTQTIYQYDEKDGVVETITVTGENVEDVDRVVAEITATPEPTMEPTPEPTAEPTPVPTPEPTAEPLIEETVESGINMWYVAGAVFALVVLVIAIVTVVKNTQNKR
ncbi:MAG: SH3 domain-containing protein, partial [Lachnospiraceae bacterium]|nr:SH3 domain-containing protein [Lachnospiraceae bacterium]